MNSLAWADLSLSALTSNLAIAKQAAPRSKVMAVIKADAYGHGAVETAKALAASDAFAVARIEEGIHLRNHGIHHDIIVLSGANTRHDFATCHHQHLQVVIHSRQALDIALLNPLNPLKIWLKIDTGMHRLGLNSDDFLQALKAIQSCKHLELTGVMSHLANAELLDNPANNQQQRLFEDLCTGLTTRSLANSAGLLFQPSTQYEWVRPGIMLYGSNPSEEENTFTRQLKPVMTLKSRVIQIKTIAQGECVGYNGIWQAEKESQIATIGIGYADGYPRHAINGTPVLINGKTYPLAGRVSMDLITVDVSAGGVNIGDEVILWGEGLSANLIAKQANTISYELFTSVTNRVKKHYIQ
jgi:alanine racemase